MDLESAVDGLTTRRQRGRAVPAESLKEHAATRCDGGASRRGRDALVRADVLVREGVEVGSGRGRGERHEIVAAGESRQGMEDASAEEDEGGGRGEWTRPSSGTWAAAKPLAVRMDLRETRRAHDAMVFRIMFDARARDEARRRTRRRRRARARKRWRKWGCRGVRGVYH